ncbi:hypothetical protein C819_02169 [Lachnospiraceae bacterium 10-1]|nr:hypothetical protein C819_02169 [Lachnospiraceae bacterium 10-1]
MGVLRHSYFFADLQTILQEYGLACKNFFNLYNKVGRNGELCTLSTMLFLLLKPFRGWILPGRVIIPVWLFLCAFCRLCAP